MKQAKGKYSQWLREKPGNEFGVKDTIVFSLSVRATKPSDNANAA